LIAAVRPHGRSECSYEREPRPSDHPRPGFLFALQRCPSRPRPRSRTQSLGPPGRPRRGRVIRTPWGPDNQRPGSQRKFFRSIWTLAPLGRL